MRAVVNVGETVDRSGVGVVGLRGRGSSEPLPGENFSCQLPDSSINRAIGRESSYRDSP